MTMPRELDFTGTIGSGVAIMLIRISEYHQEWFPSSPEHDFLDRIARPMMADNSIDGRAMSVDVWQSQQAEMLFAALPSDDGNLRAQICYALICSAYCAQAIHYHSDGDSEKAWLCYAKACRFDGMIIGDKFAGPAQPSLSTWSARLSDVRHAGSRAATEQLDAWWQKNREKARKLGKNWAAKEVAKAIGMNAKTARNKLISKE
ncbi:MAG TPA: hypothetical protein VFI49_08095 [Rudaea sp.]|nr:hypothetical protein [Rudaea sp.]